MLDGQAAAMLDEQSGVTTSPGKVTRGGKRQQAFGMGRQEDVACPSDTGGASRFFFTAKASRAERTCGGTVECAHPTVKPLSLMEYLCKLTMTPAGGLVLDPFAGSGTTGMACARLGRPFIGIEIARATARSPGPASLERWARCSLDRRRK